MNITHHLRWISLIGVCALAAGCPKSDDAGPRISCFTSSESNVSSGATVTLSWQTERATSVTLEELRTGTTLEPTSPEGSVDVVITADSLFLLTALNAQGAIERSAVSVVLRSGAHDLSLFALPAEISAGDAAQLAWSAEGATEVTITAAPGGLVDLGGQVSSGTVTVRPTTSTVYTLTASGKSATATVTVGPHILSFAATPAVAKRGAPLELAWTTQGASEVELYASGKKVLASTTTVAAGTWSEDIPANVSPGTVYSYRLVARSESGAQAQKLLEVSVDGVAAVTSFTAPAYARRGKQLTLSWTTVQADALTLSANGVAFYQAPNQAAVSSGTLTIASPAADTDYTVTATNSTGGSDARARKVISVGAPVIHTFDASPMQVSAGQPVALSWTTESAPNVTVREAIDGELFRQSDAPNAGGTTLFPSQTANYTLVADNGFGETATRTLGPVTVTNPILLTPSLPGTVTSGSTVELSWVLPGAGPITGLPHSVIDGRLSSGFDDIQPTGARLIFTSRDDDSAALPTLNFRTKLFGKPMGSDVVVSTNGYLVFGKYVDSFNFIPVTLPTSKIEPFAIAPYWADLELGASGGVYWQIKGTPEDPVLIVQWDRLVSGNQGPFTFQARIHSTGQVDFDYRDIPATATIPVRAGVQGPDPRWGLAVPANPTTESRPTFFGPKFSPVNVTPIAPGTFSGTITNGSSTMVLSHVFESVVEKNELVFTEAMPVPDSSLGAGQWLELSNFTPSVVDLTGWQLGFADGGTLPLSGTIPGNGRLVIGASTDPAANGDAGVQLALSSFALSSGAESLTLGRGGVLSSFSWSASPSAATAVVQDPGPFRWSTDSVTGATSLPRSQLCAATQAWSASPLMLGTPGQTAGCGFGYFLSRIPAGFHDISTSGTARLSAGAFDNAIIPFDVSSAQFPFFGAYQTKLYVSTNGFITTDSTVRPVDYVSWLIPAISAPNGVIAPLSADLAANAGVGQLYTKRVAANEDPFAPAPHWIVQWAHFGFILSGDDFNFQVKLFDDGTIEYHYAELRSGNSAFNGGGGYSSTWLENPAGTQAIVINAQSITPGLAWNSAFRFTPRP